MKVYELYPIKKLRRDPVFRFWCWWEKLILDIKLWWIEINEK